MKLFRVRCRGMNYLTAGNPAHGLAYVVADDLQMAYTKLRAFLDDKDLGFTHERSLDCVELVAEEGDYPECGYRLFL